MQNQNWVLSYHCSIMFNPGLYFWNLDLTKTKVLLKPGLESYVIRAYRVKQIAGRCPLKKIVYCRGIWWFVYSYVIVSYFVWEVFHVKGNYERSKQENHFRQRNTKNSDHSWIFILFFSSKLLYIFILEERKFFYISQNNSFLTSLLGD